MEEYFDRNDVITLWKCPNCETINDAPTCLVCGTPEPPPAPPEPIYRPAEPPRSTYGGFVNPTTGAPVPPGYGGGDPYPKKNNNMVIAIVVIAIILLFLIIALAES